MGILELKTNGSRQPHYSLQVAAYRELSVNGLSDGIEFDEENHWFKIDGKFLPSVTQILRKEGFCPDLSFIDPWYLQRGSYVHKVTELWDMGTLDEEALSDDLKPYLESYIKAYDECGFKIIDIEKKLYHPTWKYAGIIDRIIEGTKDYILYLTPGKNNGYKLEEVKDHRANLNIFFAAMSARAWKIANIKEI